MSHHEREGGEGPESLDDLAFEAVAAGPSAGEGGDVGPVEPIAARADRLGLDVPARLRLFQSACRAVHAEHARGRILGDLKPSRLGTVESGGTVVVPASSDAETPDVLDAWTGPPIAIDPADPDAAARAIVEQAPERPSRAAPKGRRRAIGADLDAIVLQAIRKEPERRYGSAAALADDLDAYLAGLPVRAGGTSEWGRLARFARRNPWKLAAAAAALLAVLGWGAWEAEWARTSRRERDAQAHVAATARAALAGAVDRLAEDPTHDDVATLRRDLLTAARGYYEGVVGAPAEVADALTRIATVDRALGRKAEAVAGLRAAVDLWRRAAGDRLGDAVLAERLADARVALARALDPKAPGPDADAALDDLAAAGEIYLALADRQPDEPRHRRDLAHVFLARADIEHALKRDRRALGSTRQTVALLEEIGWSDPDADETRIELASAYALLARILNAGDDPEAAATALTRAVELLDGATGPLKDSPRLLFDTASRLVELAEIRLDDDEPAAAAVPLARGVKLLEDLAAKRPAVADYRGALGQAYNLDVEILRARNQREQARRRAEEARTLLERLVVERSDQPRHVAALATSRQLLGRLLAQEGKTAEASRAFRAAADALEGMKKADMEGADAYALACDVALGLTLIGVKEGGRPIADADDPTLSDADRARREVYARRAVDALRLAVAKGYGAPDLYRRDPALDPLRPRDDFKKLLGELTAKGEPR